jgi:hypothetical protein
LPSSSHYSSKFQLSPSLNLLPFAVLAAEGSDVEEEVDPEVLEKVEEQQQVLALRTQLPPPARLPSLPVSRLPLPRPVLLPLRRLIPVLVLVLILLVLVPLLPIILALLPLPVGTPETLNRR